jgi:hypothetical protein
VLMLWIRTIVGVHYLHASMQTCIEGVGCPPAAVMPVDFIFVPLRGWIRIKQCDAHEVCCQVIFLDDYLRK